MSEKLDIAKNIETDNWGNDGECLVINMQSRPSEDDARSSPCISDLCSPVTNNPPKPEKEKE